MADATVFVVDDDQAVRSSLDMLIRSVGMSVVAYPGAREFLDGYDPEQPGCLVLDVRMPGMSGLELQRKLRDGGVDIPVIIITGHGDVPIAVRAMKDGAVEFLEKPFSKQILLEHIREAIQRDKERRLAQMRLTDIASRLDRLSKRERQVMDLIVAGKVSKEVAVELGISKKTVDVHRARVMQKMEAGSLPELVEMALTSRGKGGAA